LYLGGLVTIRPVITQNDHHETHGVLLEGAADAIYQGRYYIGAGPR
jgi:hypothetical protein